MPGEDLQAALHRRLAAHPWLGRTRLETRVALAAVGRLRRCVPGEGITCYGDAVQSIDLVLEGMLEVGWNGADGRRAVLGYVQTGELMNLVPALDGGSVMHDMRAHGAALLACFRVEVVLEALEHDPVLARGALNMLALRTRFLHEAIRHHALVPLRARLARYLLVLGERHGQTTADGLRIDMNLSQDDLAAMLNSSRQSINRELRSLADQALIAIEYSAMLLLRPDELARIAGGRA